MTPPTPAFRGKKAGEEPGPAERRAAAGDPRARRGHPPRRGGLTMAALVDVPAGTPTAWSDALPPTRGAALWHASPGCSPPTTRARATTSTAR